MIKLRLRTKFLLLLLIVSAGVTAATLWLVGRTVRAEVRKQIAEDLRNKWQRSKRREAAAAKRVVWSVI